MSDAERERQIACVRRWKELGPALERIRDEEIAGTLRLCSAEDLIVMKVFAGRDTDIRDARSIVVRQSTTGLDWSYIERHVQQLAELKDDREMMRRVADIRQGFST